MIKLSIITIVYNDKSGLKETKASLGVIPDWCEWIIVDGNSSDGTKEYALRQRKQFVTVISEKDHGIADAFNKGILASRGRYIAFINAGDQITKNYFEYLNCFFDKYGDFNCLVGKIKFGNRVIGKKIGKQKQLFRNYLPHQGMVINSSMFEKVGSYDMSFDLGMDYEWSLRVLDLLDSFYFVDEVLCDMDANGTSITNYRKTFKMYHKARIKNCVCNYFISALMSQFLILRVSLGNFIKGRF